MPPLFFVYQLAFNQNANRKKCGAPGFSNRNDPKAQQPGNDLQPNQQ